MELGQTDASKLAVAQRNESEEKPLEAPSMERLFEALESPLLAYANKLAGDLGVAQDLVQEAFLRLHSRLEFVREPRLWLYRTVHNLAMNCHRDGKKLAKWPQPAGSSGEPPDTVDPDPLPDAQIERMEAIGQTRLCLRNLNARQQELLQLKFDEGLSYKEISARTGLTVSNVGYILHHALKDLAIELKRAGISL